jgi:predicted ester cyclase
MSKENKQLIRRWFEEVWNQKSESAIDRMLDPEARAHGVPTPDGFIVGPEQFKPFHRTLLGAFPDMHFVFHEVLAEGDRVAIRWTATMTHRGDQLGFPATGKHVTLEGSSFLVIGNGKILEGWNQMEFQGMIHSLKAAAEEMAKA